LSPEHDAKLRADYPLMFNTTADRKFRRLEWQVATPFVHRGFECGDGWYVLIDALCRTLQTETEAGAPQVVANQVKEKFGTLRFNSSGQNERQEGIIEVAETQSGRVCEVCGAAGRLIRDQWIKTRCPEHEQS
jgi:hypothetical protein